MGFLFIQGSPVFDELGCRTIESTGVYQCEVGSLAGREFSSKAEALLQSEKPVTEIETTRAPGTVDHLKILSWNVKNLARGGSDYDRAAIVLGDADLVLLQEMESEAQKGKGFLNVMADLIQGRNKEKICRAWTQAAGGGRLRYGFIWKNSKIGVVDSAGELKEDCGPLALTIRQGKKLKMAMRATFFSKAERKVFLVNSVFIDKKSKDPAKEVLELFAGLSDSEWPIIVAGDLRIGAENAAFDEARKVGFRAAIGSDKRSGNSSVENFWFHNAWPIEAHTVNLFHRFPDSPHLDIVQGLSEQFPIMAEFSLNEESANVVTASLFQRATKKAKKPQRQIASQTKPRKVELSDPPENLEEETAHADASVESK